MSTTTAKSITSRKTISESFKVSIVRELSSLELFLETEPKLKGGFSMKRRIREFHVIVVSDGKDWSTKNNVLRVQSCCFA